MIEHIITSNKSLLQSIREQKILFAGNRQLKIYGKLSCTSGKKMRKRNRVFFSSEEEAIDRGFRPCDHCMYTQYKKWKDGLI